MVETPQAGGSTTNKEITKLSRFLASLFARGSAPIEQPPPRHKVDIKEAVIKNPQDQQSGPKKHSPVEADKDVSAETLATNKVDTKKVLVKTTPYDGGCVIRSIRDQQSSDQEQPPQ